jgi:hypothetical protein
VGDFNAETGYPSVARLAGGHASEISPSVHEVVSRVVLTAEIEYIIANEFIVTLVMLEIQITALRDLMLLVNKYRIQV